MIKCACRAIADYYYLVHVPPKTYQPGDTFIAIGHEALPPKYCRACLDALVQRPKGASPSLPVSSGV